MVAFSHADTAHALSEMTRPAGMPCIICLAIRAALSLYTGAIEDSIAREYEREERFVQLKAECVDKREGEEKLGRH